MKTGGDNISKESRAAHGAKLVGPVALPLVQAASSRPPNNVGKQPFNFTALSGRRRRGSMIPKLLQMPAEQQGELGQWLLEGATYKDCRARLLKRFNMSISIDATSRYFKRVVEPQIAGSSDATPLLDVTLICNGVPLRIQVTAPAGATIHTEGAQ